MHFGEFAPSASGAMQSRASPSSQTILTRIIKMQCLGFNFNPVPCGGKLCASFDNPEWGAFGKAYNEDLAVGVMEASKLALRALASRKLEHMRACKKAATIFTEYNPEEGKL